MSTLDSILQLLNRWPAWKRITEAPAELDALRRRVEALERAMTAAVPQRDQCPRCGSLTWRLAENVPDRHFKDISYNRWHCSSCQHTQTKRAE